METYSIKVNIKTNHIYVELQKMFKQDLILQIMKQIDLYLKDKIRKVVGLMKDELGGKLMTKFVALKQKSQSYLIVDDDKNKKSKGTEKCVIKRNLKSKYQKKKKRKKKLTRKK